MRAMPIPFYDLRDFLRCFVIGLNPRALAIGVLFAALLRLLIEPYVNLSPPVSAPFLTPEPSLHLPVDAGVAPWLVLGLVLLGAFVIFSLGSTVLMRSAAAEMCRWKRLGLGELRAFLLTDAPTALRLPIVIGLLSLPLLIPAGVALALWQIPVAGPWLGGVAALAALPGGLVVLLVVLASPMFFASIAVHGPDAYEAVSRSVMYVRRRPLLYFWLLAQKGSALVAALAGAWLVMRWAEASLVPWLAWLVGMLAFGYAVAVGSATDVVLLLRMRFAVDGMPFSEYYDPFEVVFDKATGAERRMAFKANGIETEEVDVYSGVGGVGG